MKLVRVGSAVLNQTPLAWDANKANILGAIEDARLQGVSILCLPELCITGYGCEDAFHSRGVQDTAWRVLEDLAPHTRGMAVSVGLPILHHNALFNAACLLVDGEISGFSAKRFLAGDGIHYEPRWFKAWPAEQVSEVERDGRRYPLGDVYFDCGGVRIGFEICEDAWVAQRPGGALARRGIDVILNPSASHFAFGKFEIRKRFVLEGSRAFGVTYVYANLVGNEAGRTIYDGGALIASGGKLVAAGRRFSFADRLVTSCVVDVDGTRMLQARSGSMMPIVEDEPDGRVVVPLRYPDIDPLPAMAAFEPWEEGRHVKEEEFLRAVALGLFDYMRKSRSAGFVVSLSGGADSAAVSCLAAAAAALGVRELGLEAYLGKLAHPAASSGARTETDLVDLILLCVYQATRQSSRTTREAARAVASGLGARFLELDVGHVVDSYVTMVERALDRELTWQQDDIALQNIQARVRAPSVWLLANIRGALLLSTSNRSEAAVGYATMDGDTAGGLAPIAGIDKAYLRRWLVWLEREGSAEFGPIPELARVNEQAPTAELRPADHKQTDEADLMPYDVLDAIERAAIRDRLTPVECFRQIRGYFPHHPDRHLAFWVARFFRLWCRNQWKRERYAPSFHLDDENLDPKTWCRFPILSGGFERELADLAALVPGMAQTPILLQD
ncbi:MAG: NAD(+) synthase [Candidatus Sericytochromatia bacterium]|nr:NAD(+) synthase [Candidatus Tanganyikabacteria bacterium]